MRTDNNIAIARATSGTYLDVLGFVKPLTKPVNPTTIGIMAMCKGVMNESASVIFFMIITNATS